MSRSRALRRIALAALTVGAVIVATACSSGGSSTSASSGGSGGSGASSASGSAFNLGVIYHSNPPDAPYQWLQGFSAYWKYLDAKGGVDGHPVNLTQFDNQEQASNTVTDFKQLVANSSVLAVTGMDISSNTAPIIPLANADKVPLFLGTSTIQASVIPTTPWVFESTELFTDSVAAMSAFAKQKGWTKVGLMYFEGDEAHTANSFVSQYVPEQGLQIVTTQYLPVTTGTLDYTSEVLAAKKGGAQVLFALQGPSGFIAIKKAEDSLGIDLPILGNPSGLNNSVYAAMGNTFYAADSPWYPDSTAPGWSVMATSLKQYSGVAAPSAPNIGGWVDGEILTAALKACGSSCTRTTFRSSIEGLKNVALGGLMAPVSFSPTDHYAPSETKFFTLGSGGKYTAVGSTVTYPNPGQ
jgi:branched-chain amino acid transport system substrate-binding protein